MKIENLQFASIEEMSIYQKKDTKQLDALFLEMLNQENTKEALILMTRINALDLYEFLADNDAEPFFFPYRKLSVEFLENLVIEFIEKNGPCVFVDYFVDYFEVQL